MSQRHKEIISKKNCMCLATRGPERVKTESAHLACPIASQDYSGALTVGQLFVRFLTEFTIVIGSDCGEMWFA